jgi:FkbM family methyltransferase
MSIVSFAQNFEDVMLWRALKNITNGFYVDIGANDPSIDSVTHLFYQNGWSGINVEPLKEHFTALVNNRERDINLNYAVSNCTDELEIWESEVRGWATLDKQVAEQHELNGFKGVWTKTPVKTLTQIFEQHLPPNTFDIHFLKIDVEGVEEAVVKSNNWSKFRPWILVIESTAPNSQKENHEEWDEVLIANDYIFSYFDGLNRFYVSREHEEFVEYFKTPPNVFDEFITHDEYNNRKKINTLENNIEILKVNYDELNKIVEEKNEKFDHISNENLQLRNEIHEIHNSNSWKLTLPFRKISSFLKGNEK